MQAQLVPDRPGRDNAVRGDEENRSERERAAAAAGDERDIDGDRYGQQKHLRPDQDRVAEQQPRAHQQVPRPSPQPEERERDRAEEGRREEDLRHVELRIGWEHTGRDEDRLAQQRGERPEEPQRDQPRGENDEPDQRGLDPAPGRRVVGVELLQRHEHERIARRHVRRVRHRAKLFLRELRRRRVAVEAQPVQVGRPQLVPAFVEARRARCRRPGQGGLDGSDRSDGEHPCDDLLRRPASDGLLAHRDGRRCVRRHGRGGWTSRRDR